MESSRAVAKSLLTTLENYGQGDYIGESISQLEHSLQAAHQAQQAGKSYQDCITMRLSC
jgi:predicted HD phosphohydrolase